LIKSKCQSIDEIDQSEHAGFISFTVLQHQVWKGTLALRISSLHRLEGESGMSIILSMGISSSRSEKLSHELCAQCKLCFFN